MTAANRRLAAIGVVSVLVVAGLVPVVIASEFAELRGLQAVLLVIAGLGFTGTGLFTWHRRPDSRIGALLVLTGWVWFVSYLGYSNAALPFTLGILCGNLFAAAVIHLLLAFPTGDLRNRYDRVVVVVGYVTCLLGSVPVMLFSKNGFGGVNGPFPTNLLAVEDDPAFVEDYSLGLSIFGVLLLGCVVAALVRRYRAASRSERTVVLPVYVMGGTVLSVLGIALSASALGISQTGAMVLFLTAVGVFALLPYVFLGALIRTRMLTARTLTRVLDRIVNEPARGALREALASAMGDETLVLAYWLPGRASWVDAAGQQVKAPTQGRGRGVAPVVHNGERVAAIEYDATVVADDQMVAAIGGAVGLAMENERLGAELRARLEELRTSRARLIEAGMSERRRLERDLHDGAQQRLVSLALTLRMARAQVGGDADAADRLLDGAQHELELALGELRELARGIHPAVLSDRGLDAALAGLAARAPLPVDLNTEVDGQVPEAIESAAYFVVSEALTNVAKYAHAESASVHLEHSQGFVSVAVRDDGIGGADPSGGSGLRGLGDRVSALDGRLEIDSRVGRGTTIRARFPCG